MVTKRPCNARMSDGDKPGTLEESGRGLAPHSALLTSQLRARKSRPGEKRMCRGATGNPAKPVVEHARKAAGKGRRSCSRTLLSCSLERGVVCDGGHARYSRLYRDDRRA